MAEENVNCCVCGGSVEKAAAERIPHPVLQGAVKFRHAHHCYRSARPYRFSDKGWR